MGKFHARLYKTDRARDFDHEQVSMIRLERGNGGAWTDILDQKF